MEIDNHRGHGFVGWPHAHSAEHEGRSSFQLCGTGTFRDGKLHRLPSALPIIGGFLASRYGSRVVINLGLVLMGLTIVLTGFAQNFVRLYHANY